MPPSPELHSLYQQFDRLIDLPSTEQRDALASLRKSGDRLALQLEGMLIYHQNQSPTESLFSVDELLDLVKGELPWRIAADLRELSSRLRWDPGSRSFQLGHFSFFGCLSVSAIGATYHARDQELDRDVVLLLLYPRWSNNHEVQQRSLDASRAVAKIFDPHVAAILGTMNIEGVFAVVRQWIPGMNLDQYLARLAAISMDQLLFIGRGIASGLHSIHEEKVLHGDLKPANIILRKDSLHPVITDFGTTTWVASNESTKWHGGTKGFVAPEILRNESPSPQSDLYSLGVILQWMATGVFDRQCDEEDWSRACQRLLGENVATESLRGLERFRELLASMLALNPAERPPDARMVADRLAQCRDPRSLQNEMEQGPQEKSRSLARGVPHPRRKWLKHAVGLTLTATAATWGGRLLATPRRTQSPAFIPGSHQSNVLSLYAENIPPSSSMAFVPGDCFPIDDNAVGGGLRPMHPGRWAWITFPAFEIPSPTHVGLLDFYFLFDTDPGQAFYCVQGRLVDSRSDWILLTEGPNLYGGFYIEHVCAYLGPDSLKKSKTIEVRLGLMFQRTASYKTDLPPVALRTRTNTPPYLAGTLHLWDPM
jgi:serine/threonine protein kinase